MASRSGSSALRYVLGGLLAFGSRKRLRRRGKAHRVIQKISSRNQFSELQPGDVTRCDTGNADMSRRVRTNLTQFLHSVSLRVARYIPVFVGTRSHQLTVTLPDSGRRFMSMQSISARDHRMSECLCGEAPQKARQWWRWNG